MKLKFTIFIFIAFSFTACHKKTQVNGVVFSKNNIPVPSVTIDLYAYGVSSYPESTHKAIATTNSNGEYQFEFIGARRVNGKKVDYFVVCSSDSGSFGPNWSNSNAINLEKTNTIDAHLK